MTLTQLLRPVQNHLVATWRFRTIANREHRANARKELRGFLNLGDEIRDATGQEYITLLDLGSGHNGSRFVRSYAERFPLTRVIFLDLEEPVRDVEQFTHYVFEPQLLERIQADGRNTGLEPGSVDVVYMSSVSYLGEDIVQGFIAESQRVLKPKGFLYIDGKRHDL
jgi:SAM-dependent methyltransferase